MYLHEDKLELGDRVYDVSVGRGFGEVIRIEDDGYVQVRFERYSVNYDHNGVQQGKSETTLYWGKPLVIKPRKNQTNWRRKDELVQVFFDTVREYAEYL